jgi:hypothetical protein
MPSPLPHITCYHYHTSPPSLSPLYCHRDNHPWVTIVTNCHHVQMSHHRSHHRSHHSNHSTTQPTKPLQWPRMIMTKDHQTNKKNTRTWEVKSGPSFWVSGQGWSNYFFLRLGPPRQEEARFTFSRWSQAQFKTENCTKWPSLILGSEQKLRCLATSCDAKWCDIVRCRVVQCWCEIAVFSPSSSFSLSLYHCFRRPRTKGGYSRTIKNAL